MGRLAESLGLFTRSLTPPDDSTDPNTVGADVATPGDPDGVLLVGDPRPQSSLPVIRPSPWSGWPADWWTPNWQGHLNALTDTAWLCIDLNASLLAAMPPYLVGA